MEEFKNEKPCQCRFKDGTQVKECDFHQRQSTLIKQRILAYLEIRMNAVFKPTFLYLIKEKVLNEIRRLKSD